MIYRLLTLITCTMLTFAMAFAQQSGAAGGSDDSQANTVYAKESRLAKGTWAKIAVTKSGIAELTSSVIRQAGFTDLGKVRIFGYGGNMVPERLTQDYLREHDDLQEIPTCMVDGRKYFYALGPIQWPSLNSASYRVNKRQRNPYSDYGYYFITQADGEGASVSQDDLLKQWRESADSHHSLYEDDAYVWSQTGRCLFDPREITTSKPVTYNILVPKENTSAILTVAVASNGTDVANVSVGSYSAPDMSFTTVDRYECARVLQVTINLNRLDTMALDASGNRIVPVNIRCREGGPVRLDYIAAKYDMPATVQSLAEASSVSASQALWGGVVRNQNHHADEPTDLIIIIPSSLKLVNQARELAQFHLDHDGVSSRIVPADELYNEFSSGTPDASAYRRYMKMFYDRSVATGSKRPSTLLLFGDAVWDSRRRFVSNKTEPFHDYLLCYESDDSVSVSTSMRTTGNGLLNEVSKKYSMASDDFFVLLKDGSVPTGRYLSDRTLTFDMAVGRIPVSEASDAQNVVDKIKRYVTGNTLGSWQNDIMFIGDDGDENSHMTNINSNADMTISRNPGYNIKKVMLDSYELTQTAAGERYDVVSNMLLKQQNDGALIINYGGHASQNQLSNRLILHINDIEKFRGENYPLWFTAACETVPYDIPGGSLGENMFLKKDGGVIAFMGTTRTVMETQNSYMNKAFTKYVLAYDDNGKPLTLGEAARRAKNDITRGDTEAGSDGSLNKHHYTLIGDPLVRLALPTNRIVIDSIGGEAASQLATIKGNAIVTVRGHVETMNGDSLRTFNAIASVIIKDGKELITCRNNAGSRSAFTYYDNTITLFRGTCEVRNGEFSFTFRMPKEISDNGMNGRITMYALDEQQMLSSNGESTQFCARGWEDAEGDNVGPSIYAYLNNKEFQNGSTVGSTPYFVAEIFDADGINASSASFGHNMQLVIDDRSDMIFDLNDNFVFNPGSYTEGTTHFVLPQLSEGVHTLSFRAWDMLDNDNTVELTFNVNGSRTPDLYDIKVLPNPVTDNATFLLTTDMAGSEAIVEIDLIDTSGRLVATRSWNESLAAGYTRLTWSNIPLASGLYLYRARVSCDGHNYATKNKKLIKR